MLAKELKVNIRSFWRLEAAWLSSYQKSPIAHLMAGLRGPIYDLSRETRKKSELVKALETLFSNAADGREKDKKLA